MDFATLTRSRVLSAPLYVARRKNGIQQDAIRLFSEPARHADLVFS
jgi:hypothetical protein